MIRRLILMPAPLSALLLIGACQTMPAVSCDNAATVRAAAELTIRAIDRACPIR
ncbi:hypothetical protein [Sphingobium sp.]|uniref:hypothetical protein n=1 Tax=Sphingobium sp. TaxID=1912891 RepID=UPI00257C344E|nr:hypothetical protein [Sphingobium sp.]MBR2270413.1 hypothetical protein [Sphingobium sp.]